MCLNRDIDYLQSSESIDYVYEIDIDWPIQQVNGSRLIIACNFCFYPITFEEHVLDEIRDENNITFGIVVQMSKLFRGMKLYYDDPLEQWRTGIICPNCHVILTFVSANRSNTSESNFEKVKNYNSFAEQIVILRSSLLYRGSSEEAHTQFSNIVMILG